MREQPALARPARRRSCPRRPSRARRGGTARSSGTGLVAQAVPTARAAFGRPIFAASAAVGDDVAAADLGVQRLERGAAEVRAHELQVDRAGQRLVARPRSRPDARRAWRRARGPRRRCAGRACAATPASSASSGSSSKPTRTTPCGPCTMSRRPIGVARRVKTASASPSRDGGGGDGVEQVGGEAHAGIPRVAERADGGGDALARGLLGAAEARGELLVVEVVDEAQPQRGPRALVQRGDQRLEGAVVVRGLGGGRGRVLREDLAAAAAMVVHGRRGRHAVQPRAEVLGVLAGAGTRAARAAARPARRPRRARRR